MSSSKRKCCLIDVHCLFIRLQYLAKVGSVTAASLQPVFFRSSSPHLHHASGSAVPEASTDLHLPLLLASLRWFFQLLTSSATPPNWLRLLLWPIHTRVCCQLTSCVFLLLATGTTPTNQRLHLNHGPWMTLPDHFLFSHNTFRHFVFCLFAWLLVFDSARTWPASVITPQWTCLPSVPVFEIALACICPCGC